MPAVAAPADRRFRRAHVKPARRRKVSVRQVWLVTKAVVLLALAVYGGWRGTALVLGAPALQVALISVTGNDRLSIGEILSIVDGLRGQNIVTVDLGAWRARLLASPWVADASIRRQLPSRIEIEIRERRPMGIGRLGRTLYLVDPEGIVIDEYGPRHAEFDLPIIDGLAGRPGGAGGVDQSRAWLAAQVMAALETRPDLAQQVSQIDVSDPHDAVVILENDTAMVRLGEAEFVERLQSYLDLAPSLRERVAGIDYVDMRFDERLYVRPVSPRAREARTAAGR
jgi:cell division septal protein FtsQ